MYDAAHLNLQQKLVFHVCHHVWSSVLGLIHFRIVEQSHQDVNTELQDVLEIHMNFQNEDEVRLPKMPCLRRMVRPTDWPQISSKVMKFADEAFWAPDRPPKHLNSLAIRFPEAIFDGYLQAQRAYIQSVPAPESGSKVWLYFADFDHGRRRLQPSLDGIQEGLRIRNSFTADEWKQLERLVIYP